MVKNSSTFKVAGEPPAFIIITINYDSKLILPIEDGLQLVKLWGNATEIRTKGYGDDKVETLHPVEKEFAISFMTAQQLKEMQVAGMLENKDEK